MSPHFLNPEIPTLDLTGLGFVTGEMDLCVDRFDEEVRLWIEQLIIDKYSYFQGLLPIHSLTEKQSDNSGSWYSILDHVNLSTENPLLRNRISKSVQFFALSELYIPDPALPQIELVGLNFDTKPQPETRSRLSAQGLSWWSDRFIAVALYSAYCKLRLKAYGYFGRMS
ncbi:MAG: hypothetical protein SFT81_00905 [Candidatus Caenarcaniphilales bacterium]|nr:hypothetical protein [Candidatus Caenarcaniphilales bacterium]